MENPRPQKVAVVTEVRERLDAAEAAILTEYRGLTVAELAALAPGPAGRRRRLQGLQEHPGQAGDRRRPPRGAGRRCWRARPPSPSSRARSSAVAKALRDYARTYPSLVVKGGLHGDGFLSTQDLDRPGRPAVARRAPGPAGRGHRRPAAQFAGLLQALPRNLAYGLSALLDERGGAPAEAAGRGPAEAEAAPTPTPPPEAEAEPPPRRPPRPRPKPRPPAAEAAAAEAPADTGRGCRRAEAEPPWPRPAAERRAPSRRGRGPTAAPRPPSPTPPRAEPRRQRHRDLRHNRATQRSRSTMATKISKDDILEGIANLSVLELSELLKDFEEKFGVTAAAPVAVAAAPAAGGGGRRRRRGREDRVRRHPHRRRRQEDPGHQGGPVPHQPGPEGGQGPGRLAPPSPCWSGCRRRTPTRRRPSSRRPGRPSRSSSPAPRRAGVLDDTPARP